MSRPFLCLLGDQRQCVRFVCFVWFQSVNRQSVFGQVQRWSCLRGLVHLPRGCTNQKSLARTRLCWRTRQPFQRAPMDFPCPGDAGRSCRRDAAGEPSTAGVVTGLIPPGQRIECNSVRQAATSPQNSASEDCPARRSSSILRAITSSPRSPYRDSIASAWPQRSRSALIPMACDSDVIGQA